MSTNINSIKRNLIDRYPFFGSIIDSLDYVETKNCVSYNGNPTAGTNGNTIYYHPDFIENLTESQQTFVFAHEVCHIAFDHINRGKDKDQEVWNYATDSVINAFLKKDGLELVDGVVDIPWAIRYDAEEMYKKLMKKKQHQQKKNNRNNNGQNNNQKDAGHDTHSLWDEKSIDKIKDEVIKEMQKQFTEMGEKEVLKQKTKTEIKEMLKKLKKVLEDMQKSQKTSDGNEETLVFGIGSKGAGTETLEESISFDDVGTSYPLINWPLILKKSIEIVELDWSYQNAYIEDGVVLASLEESSYLLSCETEIVLDTSGSIDDKLLRNFLRECKNILNFSKIKVGCFDTKFYGFTEIKNMKDIDEFTFVGRGGTSFDVAVDAFSQNASNKIIFTDGKASMPYKELGAIWIVFGNTKINPKGGKVIYIDKNKLIKLSQEDDSMILIKVKGSERR